MDTSSLTFIDWLIYAAIGRLLLFAWSKSPYCRWLCNKSSFFDELFACGFCANLWFYFPLAFLLPGNVINFMGIIVINQSIIAVITAYIEWLVETGYRTRFSQIVIKGDKDE